MDRCVLIVIINPEVKKESTFSGKKLASEKASDSKWLNVESELLVV